MAAISFNNLPSTTTMIVFDSIPNIIDIESTTRSKDRSYMKLDFTNTDVASLDEESGIDINGYKVLGTKNVAKAKGRRFLITNNKPSLALNVMNAFRSIPQLSMLFDFIYKDGNNYFEIYSKGYGNAYDLKEEPVGNMTLSVTPLGRYSSANIENELYGDSSSKIYVDVYRTENASINSNISTGIDNYVTTLEKEWSGENTRFNVSPILNTVTKYDDLTKMYFNSYAIVDGVYKNIGTVTNIYAMKGYKMPESLDYLIIPNNQTILAQYIDNQTIYVYGDSLTISVYRNTVVTSANVSITYYNSDGSVAGVGSSSFFRLEAGLRTISLPLQEEMLRNSFYVEVSINNELKVRYNIINPPYANVTNHRIYWHNCYGGVSFFDFTGNKDVNKKVTNTTYRKSLLSYYEDEDTEIIYDKNSTTEVTLATHLISESGLWQLQDLLSSYDVWIEEGEEDEYKKPIIPIEISKEEVAEKTYRVTFKYQIPSI